MFLIYKNDEVWLVRKADGIARSAGSHALIHFDSREYKTGERIDDRTCSNARVPRKPVNQPNAFNIYISTQICIHLKKFSFIFI